MPRKNKNDVIEEIVPCEGDIYLKLVHGASFIFNGKKYVRNEIACVPKKTADKLMNTGFFERLS